MRDSITHCPQGHEYNEKNTYVYKKSRICRRCVSLATAKYRRNKRAKEKLRKLIGNEGLEKLERK